MTRLGEFPAPPEKLTLMLPGGASLTGMSQLPRGLSEDCSVAFNLMLQLGPLLGSLECLIRLFKFVGGLIEVVNAAPNPFAIGEKLLDLAPAAKELAECVVAFSPLGICPPVKSMLQLIRQFLGCMVELIESVVKQKVAIQIQMGDAQSQGNDELLQVLQLAQDNADRLGAQGLQSCGPAFDLLKMIGGLLQIIGGGAIEIPSLDDLAGGELGEAIQPMKDFLQVLDTVIELLPC